MTESEPLVRNISDTARWVAVFRARESERPDALFRDPLAKRLACARGEEIAASMPFSNQHTWSFVTRTVLFDRIITEQIRQGADMVVNLAAGLDARPYRMDLPATLQWVEVDLPELVAYKEEILAGERPRCALERVRLDLSNVTSRRELFDRLGRRAGRALVVTEGLIVYLTAEAVGELARDLAAPPSFKRWLTDLASPGLLRLLQRRLGPQLGPGGATLQFAPAEGPGFFASYGWKPLEVRSMLKTAAGLGRLTLIMRLLSMLPDSSGPQGSRPWSGSCLLGSE